MGAMSGMVCAEVKKGEHKAPGGKLLRCELISNGKIQRIKITGDFFMYPEERIIDLERALIGVPLQARNIRQVLTNFLEKVVIVGASVEDFVYLILKTGEKSGC